MMTPDKMARILKRATQRLMVCATQRLMVDLNNMVLVPRDEFLDMIDAISGQDDEDRRWLETTEDKP